MQLYAILDTVVSTVTTVTILPFGSIWRMVTDSDRSWQKAQLRSIVRAVPMRRRACLNVFLCDCQALTIVSAYRFRWQHWVWKVSKALTATPCATPGMYSVMNRSSGKCNILSCDGPWRVYNTSRWFPTINRPLMVGNNDEVYDKRPQRYAEDSVTQW